MQKPKHQGGLGFKAMRTLNQAMLGKLLWKFNNQPSILWVTILKEKYCTNQSSIWNLEKHKSDSSQWKTLLDIRDIFRDQGRWLIVNGKDILLNDRRWMPYGVSPHSLSQIHELSSTRLASFINTHNRQWNRTLLEQYFSLQSVEQLCKLPIHNDRLSDQLIWPHSATGTYTVRSAYEWLQDQQGATSSTSIALFPANSLWKTRVLTPKLKTFIWRIMMGALPTKDKLKRRNIPIQTDLCPLCNEAPETLQHLLTQCSFTTSIWKIQGIDISEKNPIDLLASLLQHKELKLLSQVVPTFWGIWVARCQTIFKNADPDITRIKTKILHLQHELELLVQHSPLPTSEVTSTIYVDAAIGHHHTAWAAVAMKSPEAFQNAWADLAPMIPPYQAECCAIRKALDIIESQGWTNWRIASDCAQAVFECLAPVDQICIHEGASITEEIKAKLQANQIDLIYVPRDQNLLAHHLAKYALENSCSIVDLDSTIPSCIKHLF